MSTSLISIVEKALANALATAVHQIDSIIKTLNSEQVDNPLSLPLSNANFNIIQKGILHLQPPAALHEAITTSQTIGSDKLWSNGHMYNQLSFLINSCADKKFSRRVVDTLLFRSTAMVPLPQRVIMMLESQVSAAHPRSSQVDTNTILGAINYTAVTLDASIADIFLDIPRTYRNQMIAFFISTPKVTAIPADFDDHLPEVLLELIACMRNLGQAHVRGALTDGFKWRFVTVDLDTDGDSAKYWISEVIEWRWIDFNSERGRLVKGTSDRYDPALITGILSSWIPASFEEFQNDQWFIAQPWHTSG